MDSVMYDLSNHIREKVHDKYGKRSRVMLLDGFFIIDVIEPSNELYRYYITINEMGNNEIEYEISLYVENDQLESRYYTDYMDELYDIVDYMIDYQLGAPANVI